MADLNINIKSCLKDKFALREYCDNIDDNCNKIFIDDFIDFNIDMLNSIANLTNEEKAKDVLNKIIYYLADKIISDLKMELYEKRLILNREINICEVGNRESNYLSTSNLFRGLYVERRVVDNDSFKRLYVKNITILVNKANNNAKIKIIDGLKTTIRDVKLKVGYNTIYINYIADNDNMYILLDGKNYPNDTSLNTSPACYCCDICAQCCGNLQVVGFDGSIKTNKSFGIFAEIGEICDFSDFFCSEIDNMSLLLQEAFMSYLYEKTYFSQRMNDDTYDKIELFKKTKFFEEKYKASLKSYVLNLDMTLKRYNTECLRCLVPMKVGNNF